MPVEPAVPGVDKAQELTGDNAGLMDDIFKGASESEFDRRSPDPDNPPEPKVTSQKEQDPPSVNDPVVEEDDGLDLSLFLGDETLADTPAEEKNHEEEIPEELPKEQDKAAQAFAHLRAENKELKAQLAERGDPVDTEARVAEAVQKVTEEKDAVIAEQKQRLIQYDLREDPEFQAEYEAPIRALTNKALSLLVRSGELGDDEKDASIAARTLLGKALRMPLNQRAQFLLDQIPTYQGTILSILEDIEFKSQAKEQALKDSAATKERMSLLKSKDQQVATVKQAKAIVAKALDEQVTMKNRLFTRMSGTSAKVQEHNDNVANRERALEQMVLEGRMSDLASLAAAGMGFDYAVKALSQANSKLKEQQNTIKELKALRPGAPDAGNPRVSSSGDSGKYDFEGKDTAGIIDDIFAGTSLT